MQSVPASGCWQMFRSAVLSASSNVAMTSSTFVAVNRVETRLDSSTGSRSQNHLSAWTHLGRRARNALPYVTALWGVRARLTSGSDEKRGACLRLGGDRAAADQEPVGAAHAGDQNGGECNPHCGKKTSCRETKRCCAGLLSPQDGQRRANKGVGEEARHSRERDIPAKSSPHREQPSQRAERDDGDVRCAELGMHRGEEFREIAALGQGKGEAW